MPHREAISEACDSPRSSRASRRNALEAEQFRDQVFGIPTCLEQSIVDLVLDPLRPTLILLFGETPEGCKERFPQFRREEVGYESAIEGLVLPQSGESNG